MSNEYNLPDVVFPSCTGTAIVLRSPTAPLRRPCSSAPPDPVATSMIGTMTTKSRASASEHVRFIAEPPGVKLLHVRPHSTSTLDGLPIRTAFPPFAARPHWLCHGTCHQGGPRE